MLNEELKKKKKPLWMEGEGRGGMESLNITPE